MDAVNHPVILRLHELVEQYSLLKHPFYQAWQAGELNLQDLRYYAQQYYCFEVALPLFLSAVHSRCPIREIRAKILENLWDEEHGPENHRVLWLDFCEVLGMKRAESERVDDLITEGIIANDGTRNLLKVYENICNLGLHPPHFTYQESLAAIYAYEYQVPVIAAAKMRGLQAYYGVTDPKALRFFEVHQALDMEHSAREAEGIVKFLNPHHQGIIFYSAEQALKAWWGFLDGVNERRELHAKDSR